MHRARRVRLAGTTDDVWGDGELLGPAPLELTAVPGALQVVGAA